MIHVPFKHHSLCHWKSLVQISKGYVDHLGSFVIPLWQPAISLICCPKNPAVSQPNFDEYQRNGIWNHSWTPWQKSLKQWLPHIYNIYIYMLPWIWLESVGVTLKTTSMMFNQHESLVRGFFESFPGTFTYFRNWTFAAWEESHWNNGIAQVWSSTTPSFQAAGCPKYQTFQVNICIYTYIHYIYMYIYIYVV